MKKVIKVLVYIFYNSSPFFNINIADANLVNIAVDSSEKAYKEVWSKTTPLEKQRLLLKLAELMERDSEELAQIETLDNGK